MGTTWVLLPWYYPGTTTLGTTHEHTADGCTPGTEHAVYTRTCTFDRSRSPLGEPLGYEVSVLRLLGSQGSFWPQGSFSLREALASEKLLALASR